MYSVLRVLAGAAHTEALERLGAAMNLVQPGVFDGLRPARDGFACSVSRAPSWPEHQEAMRSFLVAHRAPLTEAVALGASMVLDVAIDRNDLECVRFGYRLPSPLEFLGLLVENRVALEFSIYVPLARYRYVEDDEDEGTPDSDE